MRSLPAVDTGSCNFGKQFFDLQLKNIKYCGLITVGQQDEKGLFKF